MAYLPGHRDYPLQEVWSWFDFRWPIEPSIRFRKQYLAWTLPYFQTSQACDRWSNPVEIAYWQVFLARQLGSDQPLPWQKAQAHLTPGIRVTLALIPFFFSYVAARRIPLDRHKMFNGKLCLHPADPLFLAVFSSAGPLAALFLYFSYGFLSDRSVSPIILVALFTLVALWEYRKRCPRSLQVPS